MTIERAMEYMFEGLKDELGLDITDENFRETPQRVSRMYKEIFAGVPNTERQVQDILQSAFPCDRDSMIVMKDVETFSMCPHHFLPVHYIVHVGYIPAGKKVLGISKLIRLVDILAKRPVLQEQFVEDVTQYLMTIDGCEGAVCIAEGKHYCMGMRGVKRPGATTTTSSMRGAFIRSPGVREEFMQLIKK